MKKRLFAFGLSVLLLLCSACSAEDATAYQKFRYHFFGTFDTIISLTGYAKDEAEFEQYAELVQNEMTRYHQIFDRYHTYEGVQNLCLVNSQAATEPVHAEKELIDLLEVTRMWRERYSVVVNPAMGKVLDLWHEAREDGTRLPDMQALQEAAEHSDYEQVVVDTKTQTIFFSDPELMLDLGAVAKGYAAQLTAETLRAKGWRSFIINAGGNVICGDEPLDGRAFWKVAVEATDGVSTSETLAAVNQSVVTSGDYQRYYIVDGKSYHHIIDPATLFPAEHMRAVTIVTADSGLADFLSTTAFLLPYEQSRALIESIPDTEAMWTLMDESVEMTEGFAKLVEMSK